MKMFCSTRIRFSRNAGRLLSILLSLSLVLSSNARPLSPPDERTRVKPGFNLFSASQDVELGREAARDTEKKFPLLRDETVDRYLNQVGKKLARYAPGHEYPYQFKGINDTNINAFALPGGFIYVNRGTIESAENEAQLAGVMAHEIAHVALRHGTNQMSKAVLAQAPLMILGGALGRNGNLAGQLAQLGLGIGANLAFMKFSRDAETQADILGAQMLSDAGYDPGEMAKFFETLARQSRGQGGGVVANWFSSHPQPENREARIHQEISLLGGVDENALKDSESFYLVKEHLKKIPAPSRAEERAGGRGRRSSPARISRAPRPSSRLAGYRHREYSLRFPANWETTVNRDQVIFAPKEGYYRDENGETVGYGLIVDFVDLEGLGLQQATDNLIEGFQRVDSTLRVRSRDRTRVAGRRAFAIRLEGRSPLPNERESDWLFTLEKGGRLMFLLFVVPESEERAYRKTFQDILDSLQLR